MTYHNDSTEYFAQLPAAQAVVWALQAKGVRARWVYCSRARAWKVVKE